MLTLTRYKMGRDLYKNPDGPNPQERVGRDSRPAGSQQQRASAPHRQPGGGSSRPRLGRSPSTSRQEPSIGSEWEELKVPSMSSQTQQVPVSSARQQPSTSPSRGVDLHSDWAKVEENPTAFDSGWEELPPPKQASPPRRSAPSSSVRQSLDSSWEQMPGARQSSPLQRKPVSALLQRSSAAASTTGPQRGSSPAGSQRGTSPSSSQLYASAHSAGGRSSASTPSPPRHVALCSCSKCQPTLYERDGMTRKERLRGQCVDGCQCTVCKIKRATQSPMKR